MDDKKVVIFKDSESKENIIDYIGEYYPPLNIKI